MIPAHKSKTSILWLCCFKSNQTFNQAIFQCIFPSLSACRFQSLFWHPRHQSMLVYESCKAFFQLHMTHIVGAINWYVFSNQPCCNLWSNIIFQKIYDPFLVHAKRSKGKSDKNKIYDPVFVSPSLFCSSNLSPCFDFVPFFSSFHAFQIVYAALQFVYLNYYIRFALLCQFLRINLTSRRSGER